VVVVAAVIVRDGKILACQRSRKDSFALKWEFPGGKVRKGETPDAALARELREELGVAARIGEELFQTRHKYPQMREEIELKFFPAELESDAIVNRVFEKIEWVEPAALSAKDFLEADRELIAKLASGEMNFTWGLSGAQASSKHSKPL
jgi:8-oxo-dGTP diphosphatase